MFRHADKIAFIHIKMFHLFYFSS